MKRLFMISAILVFGGCGGDAIGADPVAGISGDGLARASVPPAAGGVIVTCAALRTRGGNGTTGTIGSGSVGATGTTGTH